MRGMFKGTVWEVVEVVYARPRATLKIGLINACVQVISSRKNDEHIK